MKDLATNLIEKYKTRSPHELAKEFNVIIVGEPLGEIEGYFNIVNNQKFIHVNSELATWYHPFVIAHFLYYAITDSTEFQVSVKKNEYTNDELKMLANQFAAHLTVDKEELKKAGSFEALLAKYGANPNNLTELEKRMNSIMNNL